MPPPSFSTIVENSNEWQMNRRRINRYEIEIVEDEEDPQLPSKPLVKNDGTTKRAVSFGIIEIREYSRCLGNNPALTTEGPPLSIDWEYSHARTFKVAEYEKTRHAPRRPNQMMVPGRERERILLEESSTTKRQIVAMKSEIRAAKHQRQLSTAMQEFEGWQIVFESIRRKYKRFRSGISKKREMELLWEGARLNQAKGRTNFHDHDKSFCPQMKVAALYLLKGVLGIV